MTDVAALVRELIEAGTPPDVAASVVARSFAAGADVHRSPVDTTAENRRAWDRERKRKQRDCPVDSTRIPPDPVDTQLSLSSSSEVKKERKEIARGRTIPPDWTPNEKHFSLGHQLGHSRERVGEIAETMKEWAAANRNRAIARKADWDKTFNGFLRREKPVKSANGPLPVNGAPHQGEVRGNQIWFHMESPEYRQRSESRTDKYCGWWFPAA